MDAVSLGWVATAYLLASAMFLVPFGRVADIYGRKKILPSEYLYLPWHPFRWYFAGRARCSLPSGRSGLRICNDLWHRSGSLTSVFPAEERGKAWV